MVKLQVHSKLRGVPSQSTCFSSCACSTNTQAWKRHTSQKIATKALQPSREEEKVQVSSAAMPNSYAVGGAYQKSKGVAVTVHMFKKKAFCCFFFFFCCSRMGFTDHQKQLFRRPVVRGTSLENHCRRTIMKGTTTVSRTPFKPEEFCGLSSTSYTIGISIKRSLYTAVALLFYRMTKKKIRNTWSSLQPIIRREVFFAVKFYKGSAFIYLSNAYC